MHKQGNARGRAWYADLRFLLLLPVALLAAAWVAERPAERIALRYGEFKQLLLIALTNDYPVSPDFADLTYIGDLVVQPEE